MRKSFLSRGYTLLELVVSIGIIGILAVSATALFFSAIRGGGKVDVATEVKQNGQHALNTIEQITRNALDVNCLGVPDSVTLTARDGNDVTFSCQDIGSGGYIASTSATLVRLTSQEVEVTACSFSCDEDVDNLRGPLIGVSFTVTQAGTAGDVSESASVDFATTVQIRSL